MPQGSSTAPDEFSDDDLDWGAAVKKTDALVKAAQEVQAAAEREQKIQELIKEAEGVLQDIAALRKANGRGRPKTAGPAGSERKNMWEHKLARLKRGLLPGESEGAGARSAEQLCVGRLERLRRAGAAPHPPSRSC